MGLLDDPRLGTVFDVANKFNRANSSRRKEQSRYKKALGFEFATGLMRSFMADKEMAKMQDLDIENTFELARETKKYNEEAKKWEKNKYLVGALRGAGRDPTNRNDVIRVLGDRAWEDAINQQEAVQAFRSTAVKKTDDIFRSRQAFNQFATTTLPDVAEVQNMKKALDNLYNANIDDYMSRMQGNEAMDEKSIQPFLTAAAKMKIDPRVIEDASLFDLLSGKTKRTIGLQDSHIDRFRKEFITNPMLETRKTIDTIRLTDPNKRKELTEAVSNLSVPIQTAIPVETWNLINNLTSNSKDEVYSAVQSQIAKNPDSSAVDIKGVINTTLGVIQTGGDLTETSKLLIQYREAAYTAIPEDDKDRDAKIKAIEQNFTDIAQRTIGLEANEFRDWMKDSRAYEAQYKEYMERISLSENLSVSERESLADFAENMHPDYMRTTDLALLDSLVARFHDYDEKANLTPEDLFAISKMYEKEYRSKQIGNSLFNSTMTDDYLGHTQDFLKTNKAVIEAYPELDIEFNQDLMLKYLRDEDFVNRLNFDQSVRVSHIHLDKAIPNTNPTHSKQQTQAIFTNLETNVAGNYTPELLADMVSPNFPVVAAGAKHYRSVTKDRDFVSGEVPSESSLQREIFRAIVNGDQFRTHTTNMPATENKQVSVYTDPTLITPRDVVEMLDKFHKDNNLYVTDDVAASITSTSPTTGGASKDKPELKTLDETAKKVRSTQHIYDKDRGYGKPLQDVKAVTIPEKDVDISYKVSNQMMVGRDKPVQTTWNMTVDSGTGKIDMSPKGKRTISSWFKGDIVPVFEDIPDEGDSGILKSYIRDLGIQFVKNENKLKDLGEDIGADSYLRSVAGGTYRRIATMKNLLTPPMSAKPSQVDALRIANETIIEKFDLPGLVDYRSVVELLEEAGWSRDDNG
jgi:tetratricopeptide (TPR) repeat protein